MSSLDSRGRFPQDIIAIFHASFHPTQGNVVDWSLKASEDLNLEHLEFSALPSGLHLVEEDVVYFTKNGHQGVCVFRRRKTTEHGQRGFRLSSLGILLAKSVRPRAWRHVTALKSLVTTIYSGVENRGILVPTDDDWEPARSFFEERKVRRADLSGAGDWNGWNNELGGLEIDLSEINPIIHLPHLLRILGPSSLTLYKHVLGRRRILIYTLPPVEAACILCQVAADMCYEEQTDFSAGSSTTETARRRLKGKSKEGINVLGMVTLNDIDRMESEGKNGRGWIACTTDAIFLEKPSCYDLIIDLTTSTPNKATRPTFYVTKRVEPPPLSRRSTYRLSVMRFAWSDVKMWNEIDRILQLDSDGSDHHDCCGPSLSNDAKSKLITTWTDAWRVYEDVCLMCAGLWVGSWRGNSATSYSTSNGNENWGSIRLDGDDDLTINGYIRNVGMGIEGRPIGSSSEITANSSWNAGVSPGPLNTKIMRRSSGMSWSSGKATIDAASGSGSKFGKSRQVSTSSTIPAEENERERRDRQLLTTLSLLQTLHAHTSFQLSRLESFLPRVTDTDSGRADTLYLTPKDVLSFELGPLSGFDIRFLQWLTEEYGGGVGLVVKRGWKDLLGMIFGYG